MIVSLFRSNSNSNVSVQQCSVYVCMCLLCDPVAVKAIQLSYSAEFSFECKERTYKVYLFSSKSDNIYIELLYCRNAIPP